MNNKKIVNIIFIMLLVFSGGCSTHQRAGGVQDTPEPMIAEESPGYEDTSRTSSAMSGSLWKHKRTSLFFANKARDIGDILTVVIYEQASAKKEAATSTGRSSSASLGIPKLFGIETSIADRNPNLDPSNLLSAESNNDFKGTGTTSREEKLSATLTTQVVEVLNNGNLRIEGGKTVRVNHENQEIRLSGIVRPADITEYNIVDSKYILDAKIEYMGKGVISEKQKPGWMVRILDQVWPF